MHSPEQAASKLREIDVLRSEKGQSVAAAVKHIELAERAVYRWRMQYSVMRRDDTKRLQELAKASARPPIGSLKHRKRARGSRAGRRGIRHLRSLPCLH